MRKRVLMYVFNGVPPERIAAILGITPRQLRQHFAYELDNGEEDLLAWCASNVVQLAAQQENPTVALQANSQMLQARKRNWRVPKGEPPPERPDKRISRMTLAEVEAEIEALNAKRTHHD
jgi:hypothetical protein